MCNLLLILDAGVLIWRLWENTHTLIYSQVSFTNVCSIDYRYEKLAVCSSSGLEISIRTLVHSHILTGMTLIWYSLWFRHCINFLYFMLLKGLSREDRAFFQPATLGVVPFLHPCTRTKAPPCVAAMLYVIFCYTGPCNTGLNLVGQCVRLKT